MCRLLVLAGISGILAVNCTAASAPVVLGNWKAQGSYTDSLAMISAEYENQVVFTGTTSAGIYTTALTATNVTRNGVMLTNCRISYNATGTWSLTGSTVTLGGITRAMYRYTNCSDSSLNTEGTTTNTTELTLTNALGSGAGTINGDSIVFLSSATMVTYTRQ